MARYVTGQEVGTGCFRMMYMILDDSAVLHRTLMRYVNDGRKEISVETAVGCNQVDGGWSTWLLYKGRPTAGIICHNIRWMPARHGLPRLSATLFVE